MSTQIFPSLAGLGFAVKRTPIWSSKKMVSVAGLETALSYWSCPRWQWDLSFDILRSAPSYNELQTLAGFFNARQGGFDSFLYQDADDNAVTTQLIGTGDGSTTAFQLMRAFGGFVEPVLAPITISAVYLNGTPTSAYTSTGWGTSTPGVITFTTAPSSGAAVTVTFSYAFPCRFTADKMSFSMFMTQMYSGSNVAFQSLKGVA